MPDEPFTVDEAFRAAAEPGHEHRAQRREDLGVLPRRGVGKVARLSLS